MLTGSPLRMPKNNQKSKRREATAQSDDDFDDMLAELRAADLAALTAARIYSSLLIYEYRSFSELSLGRGTQIHR
jgi:hypothetical protein